MTRLAPAAITKAKAPIVCLTSYTAQVARLVDPLVDLILVGDSLGMVLYGFENTLAVTLDMMIAHGAAVVGSTSQAVVVVDMPYGSYEQSPEQALKNAQRVMSETGCSAVKLEGGAEMAATIKLLVQNDIPVMAHIGLMPQTVEKMGGFKIQGKDDAGIAKLHKDAKAIEDVGAFCVVIEGTIEHVAKDITHAITIPTIGIGASVDCDGQILVINDLLGLTPKPPKFAKRYAELGPLISAAVGDYAADVRARKFPTDAHVFVKK